jgi:hypothetical protein
MNLARYRMASSECEADLLMPGRSSAVRGHEERRVSSRGSACPGVRAGSPPLVERTITVAPVTMTVPPSSLPEEIRRDPSARSAGPRGVGDTPVDLSGRGGAIRPSPA